MEHETMNLIRLWCGENDIICVRANVGKVLTANGTYFNTGLPEGYPDLTLFLRGGITVFVETKSDKGRQRNSQKRWEIQLKNRGFYYFCVRSVEELVDKLNTYVFNKPYSV